MHNTNKKHLTVKRNGEEQGKKEVGTKKKELTVCGLGEHEDR